MESWVSIEAENYHVYTYTHKHLKTYHQVTIG